MSISVIGICGLEYYWVTAAIRTETEEFDRSVQRALHAAVTDLEIAEAQMLITERLGEPLPGFKISWNVETSDNNETTVISQVRTSSKVSNEWTEDVEIIEEPIPVDHHVEVVEVREDNGQRFKKREIVRSNGDDKDQVLVFVTEEGDSVRTMATPQSIKRKLNVYTDALEEVIVKEFATRPDLKKRLGDINIDSLLTKSLGSEGISAEFNWNITGILNSDTIVLNSDKAVPAENQKAAEAAILDFRVPIFPELPDQVVLSLGFPSKGLHVFKNLGGMLALVVLFSLFMIITFATTLNMILRQKRLSEVKSDFINNMTHEFKTPLATIGLALDSIRHPNVSSNPKEVSKFMGIIDQENKRLTSHVEKILQLAKMEKGELVIEKEVSDFNELIQETVDAFQLKLESREASLQLNLQPEIPKISIDPDHIFNAVANLLDNAIKYSTEKPEIVITSSSDSGFCKILVSDKGIGMTLEEQKNVLKTFYRAQKGDVHNVKGFGLGLSYTREVVRLHGGQMIMVSTAGKGSTIGFKIPTP